jgi:Tfp pilus assembly protein PilN
MKAVNLIPTEERGGRTSRGSGPGSYLVLGVLALLVAMSVTLMLSARSVDGKRRALGETTAQVQAAEAKAATLQSYTKYSQMRQARVERVQNLADSRFDWAASLHEVARTLPAGTWVTSLRATLNPNVSVDGDTDPLRDSLAGPAIEVAGCASSQSTVAAMMTSLRGMAGVQRVSLSNAQKSDEAAASGPNTVATGCGARPKFSLTVFLATTSSSNATTSTTAGGTTP